MKKLVTVLLIAGALLVIAAPPSDAWDRGFHGGPRTRVFVGFGPSFWWGPAPYWYYPPPAYYYPPPVVVQQPPVYVQQPTPPAPPAPAAAQQSQQYWYYCPSAQAYYPTAPTCPETWVKVPARAE
jgi:hypothetical protein